MHKASRVPLKGTVSAHRALQESGTETRGLLGWAEDNIVSLSRGHWFAPWQIEGFFNLSDFLQGKKWISSHTCTTMQQLQQQRLNGKYSSTPQLANGQMGHNQASQQQQHNSPGPHQRRSLQTSMPAYTSSSSGGGVKRGGVGGGGIPAPGFSSRIPQQKWSLIVIAGACHWLDNGLLL